MELIAVLAVLAIAAVAGGVGLWLGMLAAPRVGRLVDRDEEEPEGAEEMDDGR